MIIKCGECMNIIPAPGSGPHHADECSMMDGCPKNVNFPVVSPMTPQEAEKWYREMQSRFGIGPGGLVEINDHSETSQYRRITEQIFGKRCKDYDEDCPTCRAWRLVDFVSRYEQVL